MVEASSHGTVFHTSDWLTLCRDSLNYELKIYGCFEDDKLVGGCSLFIRKMYGILKLASSTCEMTPYGGIVIKDFSGVSARKQVENAHQIANSLCTFLSNLKFYSITITLSTDFMDVRPFKWNGWGTKVLYAYILDLDKDLEVELSKGVKRSINKAAKEGFVISKVKDSKTYFNLYSKVFKKQNIDTLVNQMFFDRVIELLKEKNIGEMWVVSDSSEKYAAARIWLWDKKRVYAWAGASDADFRISGANTLLYYEVIKELKKEGHKEINMMAANTQRFSNFVIGFNPNLTPYYSINYNSCMYNFLEICLYPKITKMLAKLKKRVNK